MKIIDIQNLSVSIEDKNILKNINIQIKKGEFVAILGKNGNGKTSILKSIMNYYKFFKEGKIFFEGKDISNLDSNEISKLGIWYIPQNSEEIRGLKVIDFLKSILKERNIYEAKEFFTKIEKLSQKLELPHDIFNRDLNVGFSGGEKKKLELLQLLLVDPKVILIDEIDSGLDLETNKKLISILLKLKKENKTLLIISHNPEIIDKLSVDKIIQIESGEVI